MLPDGQHETQERVAAVDESAQLGSMVPSLRTLWPQLLVSGVMPIIAYRLLRPHLSSDAEGLSIVLLFPLGQIAFDRIRRGRLDPVSFIALFGILLGLLGAAVLHGNTTLLKVRDSVFTGFFGVYCLLSLFARRPAMFYLGRLFAAGQDPAKVAEFDLRWELPTVPHRFRVVTVVWGLALSAEAIVRTVLAISVSTQLFLLLAQIINWTVLGALIAFSVGASRAGERQVADLVARSEAR